MKPVALFDLDDTLLLGDSDKTWGDFLAEKYIVEPESYTQKNHQFYQDYVNGTLDIHKYHEFSLEPLRTNSLEKMLTLRSEFIELKIKAMISEKAHALVKYHQSKGHECIIITATQSFVTQPIAALFDVKHLIATEPEIINGQFTGKLQGTPCFQGGKVIRLQEFLEEKNIDLKSIPHIYAYSDSYNDLPLLELAHTPVAVNPDQRLSKHAQEQGWEIIHTTHIHKP